MTGPEPLKDILARLELYEPELGETLRQAPRLQALTAGRAALQAWDASSLTFLYGQSHQAAFDALLARLRLPEAVHGAVLRREQSSRHNYYWNWEFNDRVERVVVEDGAAEVAFVTRRGPHRLRVTVPALVDAQRAAALEWLARPATLTGMAQGNALTPEALAALELVPAWAECAVAASARSREVLETGLHFLCRALIVHPVYLPILRGLGGEEAVRVCATRELARRQAAFDEAVQDLPAQLADFWAAPAWPEVPALGAAALEPGLGSHLPPADFWSKPEDNQLLTEALIKVYRNVPRKLARLTQPRRPY